MSNSLRFQTQSAAAICHGFQSITGTVQQRWEAYEGSGVLELFGEMGTWGELSGTIAWLLQADESFEPKDLYCYAVDEKLGRLMRQDILNERYSETAMKQHLRSLLDKFVASSDTKPSYEITNKIIELLA